MIQNAITITLPLCYSALVSEKGDECSFLNAFIRNSIHVEVNINFFRPDFHLLKIYN